MKIANSNVRDKNNTEGRCYCRQVFFFPYRATSVHEREIADNKMSPSVLKSDREENWCNP